MTHCLAEHDLAADSRQICGYGAVVAAETLADVRRYSGGQDSGKEVVNMIKFFCLQSPVVALIQLPKGVGQHIVEVLYRDGFV